MHLDLVEARRGRRKADEPVDANNLNAAPPRRQRERVPPSVEQAAQTYVLCLNALARITSPDVLRDVAGLPRPEGEPAHQGRRLQGLLRPKWPPCGVSWHSLGMRCRR